MSQTQRAQHNLPASLTPLVGRMAEYDHTLDLLRSATCRMISVVGTGGVGKTRLALECAWALVDENATRFPDGVYLVSLAELNPSDLLNDLIATEIADALGLSFSGTDTPSTQLQHYLHARSILLLLDNFEHLSMAAPFLAALLEAAPALTLLVTTREPLRLRSEWIVTLHGLSFPDSQNKFADATLPAGQQPAALTTGDLAIVPGLIDRRWSIDELQQYGAIQLFVQAAKMYDANFRLSAETAPAVVQICQFIDGLPLGIELATSWLRTLSCTEIAAELAHGFDILTSAKVDLTPRQQSLRALFNSSWRLLRPNEQQALGRLSVFRGGFTRKAAAAVADVPLPVLATLVDKSLLHRKSAATANASRYELLVLVRQYAAEQLEQAGDATVAANNHAAYFADLLAAHTADLRGAGQQAALSAIGQEIAEIRAAWRWACESANARLIARAADGLFHFYDMHSLFQEGAAAFQAASAALATHRSLPDVQRVWAHALARQAWFIFYVGQQREAQALLEQSITALRALGARAELIFSLNYQGAVCSYLGEYATTEALCREALELAQALGDRYGQAIASNILGQAAYDQGQYAAAQNWSQQSLAIEQQLGNRWSMSFSLTNLGKVAFITGEYAEARWCFEESLQIRQGIGDTRGVAICLNRLGETAVALGAADEARERYNQSLQMFRSIGSQWGIAAALIHRAHLALTQADPATALPMLHEALQLALELESLPQVVTILATCAPLIRRSSDRTWADALDQVLEAAPTTLEPYQAHARRLLAWAKNNDLAQRQPITTPPAPPAHSPDTDSSTMAQQRAAAYPAGLTAREVDVLRLVAQGLTDAQVADKLIVSRRTVSTHLSAIYGKLQVNSRSAATRFALEQGLG
jgi:predicted ATPase/DNA-binding CsgD family transcriptional regulator